MRVSWRRWPLAVGPAWRTGNESLAFDLSLAPALVWLRVSGSDFQPSKAQNGVTWAGIADARLASRGRFGWFFAANAQAHLARSSAYAGDSEYDLPRFVACLLFGARLSP